MIRLFLKESVKIFWWRGGGVKIFREGKYLQGVVFSLLAKIPISMCKRVYQCCVMIININKENVAFF